MREARAGQGSGTRRGRAAAAALVLGVAALAAASATAADPPTGEAAHAALVPKADAAWMAALAERGTRKVYTGAELQTIGMPCGGVAAGQVYVRGDGTLASWVIFNNVKNTGYGDKCYRTYRPDSPLAQGFVLSCRPEGGGEGGAWPLNQDGFDAIEFVGEYPVAEVRYRTQPARAPPVEVDLEVFSPLIPLLARDSGLPATVLRFTVRNLSPRPQRATLAGWLQNGVLLHEAGTYRGESRNRVRRAGGLTSAVMDFVEAPAEAPTEPRRERIFEDFEDGLGDRWTVEGDAGAAAPAAGKSPTQQEVAGWHGKRFINTYQPNDAPQCTLASKPFRIAEPYIAFLIGGGSHAGETCLNLVVGDRTVRTATGQDKELLQPAHWDVREFLGREARIEIVDKHSGPWGHVNVDFIRFTNFIPGPPVVPPADHPGRGDMALSVLDGAARAAAGLDAGADPARGGAVAAGAPEEARRTLGEPLLALVATELALAPREVKAATFLVTWHFPRRARVGQMYGNWFQGSLDVAAYVAANLERLRGETRLFRDTYFDTTLPYWLAARLAMPVSTLATETCQWWADGRFYAWEGVGCCPGTCTHVWNYEHATGRLFPELARSTRLMQDLGAGFDEATGLVGFRGNRAYAADGQAGTVLKVYREHLMSADGTFLEAAWPKVRKALEFLLGRDGDEDGLIEDSQHNTFDINFEGPNTFVGSLYLAALRAGEEMARLKGDAAFAARCRAAFDKGSRLSVERLFNGEYFTQIIPPGKSDRHQYGSGCLSDQVFGQGWARQLGLGDLYPPQAVRSALAAVFRHNWTADVGRLNERWPPERWFARPGEAGLFTCTWPRGGRPAEPVRYRDEVWTGIEYQVAGHMLYEGMVPEALAMIRGVHDRYDGARHNPWNEVECGDHYARAMASWGCLLAICGYVYDGPAGRIGFAPRLAPENFKAFFTASEGWGSLVQKRAAGAQTDRLEVKWGRLRARKLEFEAPDGAAGVRASVTVAGRPVKGETRQDGRRVTVTLAEPAAIERGEAIEAGLRW